MSRPIPSFVGSISASRYRLVGASVMFATIVVFGAMLTVERPAIGIPITVSVLAGVCGFTIMLSKDIFRMQSQIEILHSEIPAFISLFGLNPVPETIGPHLNAFSLTPSALVTLLGEFSRRQPKVVVELGSGSSTILFARFFRNCSWRCDFISVEHDECFALKVVADLTAAKVAEYVQLVCCRLEVQSHGDWSGLWYSEESLACLPDLIDVLLVDGPPGDLQRRSRYPAFSVLSGRLAPGALVMLDDTDRGDEARDLSLWRGAGGRVVAAGRRWTLMEFGDGDHQTDCPQ